MFFNTGCNEQVFSPKPCKKIWNRSVLPFSRKTRKLSGLIESNFFHLNLEILAKLFKLNYYLILTPQLSPNPNR